MFEDGGESLETGAARCHFYQASGETAAKRHDNARRQCAQNCSPPKIERCPGENNCAMFAVAKLETTDGLDACRGCHLYPTKHGYLPPGKCPNENNCADFKKAAGANRAEKEMNACIGENRAAPVCPMFVTKPLAITADSKSEAEQIENLEAAAVENLVDEIADIVFWEDAASSTDWTLYPFEYRMLYGIWREAERKVKDIRERRMQTFIKSFWGDE